MDINCFKNSIRDPRGFLGKFGDYQECLHVALLVVIEEKQLKEGYLWLLVGCLMLCYYRESSDTFTKIKIFVFFPLYC